MFYVASSGTCNWPFRKGDIKKRNVANAVCGTLFAGVCSSPAPSASSPALAPLLHCLFNCGWLASGPGGAGARGTDGVLISVIPGGMRPGLLSNRWAGRSSAQGGRCQDRDGTGKVHLRGHRANAWGLARSSKLMVGFKKFRPMTLISICNGSVGSHFCCAPAAYIHFLLAVLGQSFVLPNR